MDLWQIGVPVASALVAIGSALGAHVARREPSARETVLPPALPPAPAGPSSAELEALRTRLGQLEGRVGQLEDRERGRDEAAAEFRGDIKARLARIFERLKIRWEERHGGDRGSEG